MSHILVVANQTLGCAELETALESLHEADATADVYIVAPVTGTEEEQSFDYPGVDRYVPDPSEIARQMAAGRLELELSRLEGKGISAAGEVVTAEPVERVRQLVQERSPSTLVVCTLPKRLSRWLRTDLPTRISRAVTVPVQHVPGSAGPSL